MSLGTVDLERVDHLSQGDDSLQLIFSHSIAAFGTSGSPLQPRLDAALAERMTARSDDGLVHDGQADRAAQAVIDVLHVCVRLTVVATSASLEDGNT